MCVDSIASESYKGQDEEPASGQVGPTYALLMESFSGEYCCTAIAYGFRLNSFPTFCSLQSVSSAYRISVASPEMGKLEGAEAVAEVCDPHTNIGEAFGRRRRFYDLIDSFFGGVRQTGFLHVTPHVGELVADRIVPDGQLGALLRGHGFVQTHGFPDPKAGGCSVRVTSLS